MKTTSINHPWAISEKYQERYGAVWSTLDFVFADKSSEENFKTDPMNTVIGNLEIFNQSIKMTYKDLINYSKSIRILMDEVYVSGNRTDVHDVKIKSQTFSLKRHELRKLSETLSDANTSSLRAYELGLYL
jgi:hypothetical protein